MDPKQRIRSYIVNELHQGEQDVSDDVRLLETEILDSMKLLQLITFLESEFGIEVLDEDLVATNFDTLDDITHLVALRQAS